MIDFKNKVFTGSADRKSLYDCHIKEDSKAVVIFVHGYKGFKDWGAWNIMEKEFVDNRFGFVKFNMSHNGGTINEPIDFPDLESFGNNRYSYEVFDLNAIITLVSELLEKDVRKALPIYLFGHSRGGGVSIIQAYGDERIKKVVSLAGISDIASRFPEDETIEKWEETNVITVHNGRTKQEMPLYYSLYLDFVVHHIDLDIEIACRGLNIPFMQIHGDKDESVSISEGQQISEWTHTDLQVIKGAGHTFGAREPWESKELPVHLQQAVDKCIEFFNK